MRYPLPRKQALNSCTNAARWNWEENIFAQPGANISWQTAAVNLCKLHMSFLVPENMEMHWAEAKSFCAAAEPPETYESLNCQDQQPIRVENLAWVKLDFVELTIQEAALSAQQPMVPLKSEYLSFLPWRRLTLCRNLFGFDLWNRNIYFWEIWTLGPEISSVLPFVTSEPGSCEDSIAMTQLDDKIA